jgi:hypothetical protein
MIFVERQTMNDTIVLTDLISANGDIFAHNFIAF